jgi:hypothetical protein
LLRGEWRIARLLVATPRSYCAPTKGSNERYLRRCISPEMGRPSGLLLEAQAEPQARDSA